MKKLNKAERIQSYLSLLGSESSVTNKTLFNFGRDAGIPEITVRRDIQLLEKLNYININLGIITLNDSKEYETTRQEKLSKNRQEKIEISLKTVDLLTTTNIFVGAGTTCEFFVKAINKTVDTLYTNGIEVAKIASSNDHIKNIIIIGGKLRLQSGAMCGPVASTIIDNLKFNQSFITVTNMDKSHDLFNNNDEEAFLTKKIIDHSQETICLIDHTKFNSTVYGNKIANVKDISKIVTDSLVNPDDLKELKTKVQIV